MAKEQKSTPLVIEVPVPWSNQPMVIKSSFWLAVVVAVLIMVFAAAYFSDWGGDRHAYAGDAPVIAVELFGDRVN